MTGKGIGGAVRYNEQKVATGQAAVLDTVNYGRPDPAQITYREKVGVLETLAAKNPVVTRPVLHVALAFHPSEQMDADRLRTIARQFMDELGYGRQPYLLYRHDDTRHPHVHLVSVSVDRLGNRVADGFLKRRCQQIRTRLEQQHGLIQAQGPRPVLTESVSAWPDQPVRYGIQETKAAIEAVVRAALTGYSLSSFLELGVLLESRGVRMKLTPPKAATATGLTTPNGDTSIKVGISFQLTDGGRAQSRPVPASRLSFSPTAVRLEARFRAGRIRQVAYRPELLSRIGPVLTAGGALTETDFLHRLRLTGVEVIGTGGRYLYVDHRQRAVFAEAMLGEPWTRAGLQARFARQPVPETVPPVVVRPAVRTKEASAQLAQRVLAHYRAHRETAGEPFESRLITRFPYDALVSALQQEGFPLPDVQAAVRGLERTKQQQSAAIVREEQTAFARQATALLNLAAAMPIAPDSRRQFLQAMHLDWAETGRRGEGAASGRLIHARNPALMLTLTPAQLAGLNAGPANRSVPFPALFTPAEQAVYSRIALGEPVPPGGFYPVNAARLKACLPVSQWQPVGAALNQAYLDTILAAAPAAPADLPRFLFQRGLVLTRSDGGYRAGFYLLTPGQFARLPGSFATRLTAAGPLPPVTTQVAQLTDPAGRRLVRLVQAVDTGQTARATAQQAKLVADQPAWAGLSLPDLLSALTDQARSRPQSVLRLTPQPAIVPPATVPTPELRKAAVPAPDRPRQVRPNRRKGPRL